MYVNIKKQKYGLNLNPACSASLGVYEWRRRSFVSTNTEAHVNSVIFGLCISLHELAGYESHFMIIFPFHLRKLASYTNFTATCQNKSAVLHVTEILLFKRNIHNFYNQVLILTVNLCFFLPKKGFHFNWIKNK